jgi:hypothetical protein
MKPSVALTTALSGAYLARAIVVMIIVGSVLNLINQGEALFPRRSTQLRQTLTHLCRTILRIDLRNVVRPDCDTLTGFIPVQTAMSAWAQSGPSDVKFCERPK